MTRKLLGLLILTLAIFAPTTIYSLPIPQSSDDVKTSGSLKPEKVSKGKSAQATILVEIPQGLHLQSSKPLDKFLVPTKLEVETPARVVGVQQAARHPQRTDRLRPFARRRVEPERH